MALTVNDQSSNVRNAQQQRSDDNCHGGVALVELFLHVDLAGDEVKGKVANQHQHDADESVAHRIHDTRQQGGHVHNWHLSVQLDTLIDFNERSELHHCNLPGNGRQ